LRLRQIPQFDSWEPQLLQALLDTPDLRFLWAMQELTGTDVKDYSVNARHGTYGGVIINQNAPNRRINKTMSFDGINDKIITPLTCSVKGLSAYTFSCVLQITDISIAGNLFYESNSDLITASRFIIRVETDRKISIFARSKISTLQPLNTIVTNISLPLGYHMLHFVVDIVNNKIEIYRNGIKLTTTGAVDFTGSLAVDDTDPLGIVFGSNASLNANWLKGKVAYISQWSRVLTQPEMIQHTKSGGFA